MYLANDVIQNSKKKGPEYGLDFGKVLKLAFAHIGETCSRDDKTLSSLGRILVIWEDRGVYDEKAIQGFRDALNRETNGKDEKAKSSAPSSTVASTSKRKAADPAASTENGKEKEPVKKSKSSSSSSSAANAASASTKERGKRETVEVNGAIETHVILSPKAPAGDPPEPEELIKALMDLESSASSDANIREQIANLPPAVSEVSELNKLQNKEAAAALAKTVLTFPLVFPNKDELNYFLQFSLVSVFLFVSG